MIKIYALSKGWLALIVVCCSVFFLASFYLMLIDGEEILAEPATKKNVLTLVLIIVGLVFPVYGIIESFKSKLVVGADSFTWSDTFGTRQLPFSEVKGFRSEDKYLTIVPVDNQVKRIKVSRYFHESEHLLKWLKRHFSDLDMVQYEEEKELVLWDDKFGYTRTARDGTLANAQKAAQLINIAGFVLGLITYFVGDLLKFTLIIVAIFVPVVVLFVKRYNGLVRLDLQKNNPSHTIAFGLGACILALLVKCLMLYGILDYRDVLLFAGQLGLALFVLIVVGSREIIGFKVRSVLVFIFLLVFCFAYGFSLTVGYNCIYDDSESKLYSAEVLEKNKGGGQTASYHFKLGPWGPVKESNDVEVSSEDYDSAEIGDKVNIYLYKGKLNVPWFQVNLD